MLDDSADICDVVQLRIFIAGGHDNLNIFEEIIGLRTLHEKTRRSDIFEEEKSCIVSQQLNLLHSYASVLVEHHQLLVELLELFPCLTDFRSFSSGISLHYAPRVSVWINFEINLNYNTRIKQKRIQRISCTVRYAVW